MPRAYLKPTRERRVEQGHPWVFRSDIDRVEKTANPGDVDDDTPATAPTAALLEKYSWDKSAERLLQILEK